MAELVGGAFLSAALQVACEKLASSEMFDFFRRKNLNDSLLEKLHIILISVNQVIEDAEEMQYRNPNVKKWLDELKHVVFKAEDLLDDIDTEASQQKLHAEFHTVTSKVRGFLTPSVTSFDKEIEPRIQKVLDTLEYLIKQNEILGLKARFGVGTEVGVNRKLFKRLPTSSLLDESNIYGRDAEKENMISILLSHSGNQPLNVISITGLGGMGKTTLARLVYDDKRMKDEFQLRAWVTISEEFDVLLVTKAILQALNCSIKDSDDPQIKLEEELMEKKFIVDCSSEDFDDLQIKLKKKLMGKKFIVALDDVWNENRPKWDAFLAPFKYGAAGSKILVTTRNKSVANVMDSTHVHLLKQLQDEDGWKLFAKHAFNDQHNGVDPNLKSIGREIVQKCGGLPLAIKTLGSLLHTKLSPQHWNKILESDIWDLSEDDSKIIPSLRLSYHYLPSNLKRCFAYCSIFPKDYEIDKDVLVQLWMAEGLLHSNQRGMRIDEVGNEIFNDLESRAFFEPSKSHEGYIVMHDLVNDLAKSVMGEFYVSPKVNCAQDIPIKARYFSYLNSRDFRNHFDALSSCHQLRSFLSFQHFMPNDIMEVLLSRLGHLKYMRALSLKRHRNIENLPNDIGNLKHLRYLDLSHTEIESLPDSTCLLINLQTLKLKGCRWMTKLPSNFHKLINLCHLDLEGSGIKEMPQYMRKLKYLRASTIIVKHNQGLKQLGTLKDVHLNELVLHWGLIAKHQEHIRNNAFQPNCDVKEVTVEGYGGTKFPDCVSLPPLGQLPFLEKLRIFGLDGLRVIGNEFYGSNSSSYAPFRSLSTLGIKDMKELEEWNICYEGDSFPCLQKLFIMNCPKLTLKCGSLSSSLRFLGIDGCPKLIHSRKDWGLHNLLSLEHILVCNHDFENEESFPEEGLLPPNLRSLELENCSKLKAMNYKGLLHLHSLQSLSFEDCPLLSFENFPDEGLPRSLSELRIMGKCPLLKQRCQKEKGQDWSKISHIPSHNVH